MIHHIRLFQFRNYSLQEVHCERFNVFIGPNGQGKTNLLESIAIGYSGQYLRSSQVEALVQNNCQSALIEVSSEVSNSQYTHRFVIENQKRKFFLNNKPTSVHALNRKFPIVTFMPEHVGLFKNSPEIRRNELDTAVKSWSQSEIQVYVKFHKLLISRNRLLRMIQEGNLNDKTLWDQINNDFLKESARLTWFRLAWLREFLPIWKNVLDQFWQLDGGELTVRYLMSQTNIWDWSFDDILRFTQERSLHLRDAEMHLGTSLVGAQRHDWECWWRNQNLRLMGSQGQHRALVLGFKMALVYWYLNQGLSFIPLLLDDVFSEFDLEHQKKFWIFLNQVPTQVFLTAALMESEFLKEHMFQPSIFQVIDGKVIRKKEF